MIRREETRSKEMRRGEKRLYEVVWNVIQGKRR